MDVSTNTDEVKKPEGKSGKKQITLERLRIALEKLQLARAKTNLTLIALGFTAYKFFYARIAEGKRPLLEFPNGRHIGIFLIFIGLVMLSLSTIQHQKSLVKLKSLYKEMHYSVSLVFSYVIILLSIFLLFVVILKM